MILPESDYCVPLKISTTSDVREASFLCICVHLLFLCFPPMLPYLLHQIYDRVPQAKQCVPEMTKYQGLGVGY